MCGLWSSTDQDDQKAIEEARRAGDETAKPIAINLKAVVLAPKTRMPQQQARKRMLLRRLGFQRRQNVEEYEL